MPIPPIIVPILGIDKLSGVLGKAEGRIGRSATNIMNTGQTLTTTITAPIVGAGVAVTKMSMDLNKAMANVGTLIPGQQNRLEGLKTSIQDLAVESGKRTGDLAAGLFQTISAFGDSAETMDLVKLNTRGAIAGVSDLKSTITLTGGVMNAFNDTSAKMNRHILNLAFKANELGITTFPEMAASMGRATNFAANLGVSLEEMFASVAFGTKVGQNTAEATTSLRSLLGALIKPTGGMIKAFDALGISSGKSLIAEKGLAGAIRFLDTEAKKVGLSISDLIERKEALTLALGLTGKAGKTYNNILEGMKNSNGALDAAFKEQTKGINKAGFAWERFVSKLQVSGQQIGDELAPVLTEFLDNNLDPLLTKLKDLTPAQIQTGLQWGKWLAILGPVTLGVGVLSKTINDVIVLLPKLLTGWQALASFITGGTLLGALSGIGLAVGLPLLIAPPLVKKIRSMANKDKPMPLVDGLIKALTFGKVDLGKTFKEEDNTGPMQLDDNTFNEIESQKQISSREGQTATLRIEGVGENASLDFSEGSKITSSRQGDVMQLSFD